MRIIASTLLLFLLLSASAAQEKERWQRIQMYDDVLVEVDAANVVFGSDFTGRVKFRFSYLKSQPLAKRKSVKYKRVIQTMEFGCPERRCRIVSVERLDGKGNQVEFEKAQPEAEWKPIGGSLLDNMFKSGCDLIYEKKKKP